MLQLFHNPSQYQSLLPNLFQLEYHNQLLFQLPNQSLLVVPEVDSVPVLVLDSALDQVSEVAMEVVMEVVMALDMVLAMVWLELEDMVVMVLFPILPFPLDTVSVMDLVATATNTEFKFILNRN